MNHQPLATDTIRMAPPVIRSAIASDQMSVRSPARSIPTSSRTPDAAVEYRSRWPPLNRVPSAAGSGTGMSIADRSINTPSRVQMKW
jgi:hypothetical protein